MEQYQQSSNKKAKPQVRAPTHGGTKRGLVTRVSPLVVPPVSSREFTVFRAFASRVVPSIQSPATRADTRVRPNEQVAVGRSRMFLSPCPRAHIDIPTPFATAPVNGVDDEVRPVPQLETNFPAPLGFEELPV